MAHTDGRAFTRLNAHTQTQRKQRKPRSVYVCDCPPCRSSGFHEKREKQRIRRLEEDLWRIRMTLEDLRLGMFQTSFLKTSFHTTLLFPRHNLSHKCTGEKNNPNEMYTDLQPQNEIKRPLQHLFRFSELTIYVFFIKNVNFLNNQNENSFYWQKMEMPSKKYNV